MCARPPSSTCTGCVTGVDLACAWIVTTCASRRESDSLVRLPVMCVTSVQLCSHRCWVAELLGRLELKSGDR